MKKEYAEKWVEALRSGKYQQGTGNLCLDNKYCCLGVLEDAVRGEINSTVYNESKRLRFNGETKTLSEITKNFV